MNMTPDPTQAGQSAFIFFFFSQGGFLAAPEYEMPAETRDARRIRERERLKDGRLIEYLLRNASARATAL